MRTECLKRIAAHACFLTLMLAMPSAVKAQANWTNVFTWSVINDSIYIQKYLDTLPPPHAATIPDTIDGLPVIGLSLGVFRDCTNLIAVTLGDRITYIGDYVFSGCSNLTGATIPNRVNTIGSSAFEGCISLTHLSLGTNITRIGQTAFRNCRGLTSVTIPSSVTFLDWLSLDCGPQLAGAYFEGNPPKVDIVDNSLVFGIGNTNTTIYYLPGTTGWTNTFPGLPTALWRPQLQSAVANFGLRSNQFEFNISWARGRTVVVEAAANTAVPTWNPVSTNTLPAGLSYFGDPEWTNYQSRFYRVRVP